MQPLLLLKQTLEATYDPGSLLLNGPNIRLTSTKQFLSHIPGSKASRRLFIEFEISNRSVIALTFTALQNGLSIDEMKVTDPDTSFVLRRDMTHDDILALQGVEPMRQLTLQMGQSTFFDRPEPRWRVGRTRCFLNLEYMLGDTVARSLQSPTTMGEAVIRSGIHVPGLRGHPDRAYKTTAVGSEFPGTFENYVASVVNHWQHNDHDQLIKLGAALEQLGLTWTVEARQIDDTQVELQVGRLPVRPSTKRQDVVSIADVGFGVSQVLPVVVALLAARPGQFVYIEQPEIHLHPRAQSAMAAILSDAANRGVRVIVETHSSLLLLGIQTLVAEGALAPEDVALQWFRRLPDGTTRVTPGELNEAGAFGEWPEDFGETSLKLESRYLDSAEERLLRATNAG